MIKRIDFSKAAKKLRVNLIYELTETDEVCNEDEMYEIYENFNNMEDEQVMNFLPQIIFKADGEMFVDETQNIENNSMIDQ